MTDLLWYAAYGSNLSLERFTHYLQGGRPPGADRSMQGARDATPPRDMRPIELPGSVFFGWRSSTWGGGGVAFYDPDVVGRALATAYLITREQFADLVAQEMHRPVGADPDLERMVAAVLRSRGTTAAWELGQGRYERLLVVDELDDLPVVTFTCPAAHRPAPNAPNAAYLATIARGLRETHHLDDEAVAAYLSGLDGSATAS
ncbi:histone deacetylase [Calidifontibacter terrae]